MKNCLFMNRRLDAHAAEIAVDVGGLNAHATLVNQFAYICELFIAVLVERLP
ncbi:hypothetical protein D3C71_1911350 [compost metagenome]